MHRTWDDEDLESIAETIEAAKAAAWKMATKVIDDTNQTLKLHAIGKRIGCSVARLSSVRLGQSPPGLNLLRKLAKMNDTKEKTNV